MQLNFAKKTLIFEEKQLFFLFSNGSADCVSMGNELLECGSPHLPRISYITIT